MGEYTNVNLSFFVVLVIGTGAAFALAHYRSRRSIPPQARPRGAREARHRFECGHGALLEDTEGLDSEYCPKCIESAVIPCGRCGESIHPGDIVTAYFHDYSLHGRPPEGAVLYPFEDSEEYGQTVKLIACTRAECARPGSYDGRWIMPGVVNPITPLGHAHQPAGSILLN